MNILINLSTLKKGGGQNVALNFLQGLYSMNETRHTYYFLVVENSYIHQFLRQKNIQNIIITSSSPVKRVLRELFLLPSTVRKFKIDIIYTYFGYAIYRGKTPQVCGVAVSNVFFPEIKFWQGNILHIIIRKIVDYYRIYGLKNADALIFENKSMEIRSHTLFKIPRHRTIYIPPSFNSDFTQEELNIPDLKNNTIKLLMLCGWQLNKNIMRVPEIAYFLKNRIRNIQFIITAPKDDSNLYKAFQRLVNIYNVGDVISIIGPVKKQQLLSLYSQIDFVLLMSKLESFSNNIIEAWHFHKPLIVSDEKWSRSICGNAAYYINREMASEAAASIEYLILNTSVQKELIERGCAMKKEYPSIAEKTRKEISFLEKIFNEITNNI